MKNEELIQVKTKPCIHCGAITLIEMTRDQYDRVVENKEYIQDIFPDKSADYRELVISGIHPTCWIELFGDEEE